MTDGPASDLKTVLAQRGPFDPARAVQLVREIAAAIDDAHAHQTVHRNVTTANIVLAADGSAYLAEFGGATPSADRTRVLVTDTEAVYRADIAALAGVLYECLTGQPPNPAAPVPQPGGIPAELGDVIARATAADGAERYRSAGELAAAAQRALAPNSNPAPPSAAATRTFALPQRPASAPQTPNPVVPQWNPIQGHSPTVSYPHSRPVQLPVAPPRRRRYLAPALAIVAVVGAVVAGAIMIPKVVHRSGSATPTTTTLPPRRTYTAQPTVLPFPDMYPTKSIAVDGSGNIYALAAVTPHPGASMFETEPLKLWKLAPGAGAATSVEIPGVNFRSATDLAVDKAGNVYYSDTGQVYMLEAGKSSPIRLPFRGFSSIQGIAVDNVGNTYAVGGLMGDDSSVQYGVRKLALGENRPTDVSFGTLYLPRGIAVDKDGTIYVSNSVKGTGHGQVLKLPVGATAPVVVPIPGLIEPNHIAFDNVGDIFVGDGFGKGFFQLPPGRNPVEVSLGAHAMSVAVDSAGTVYALTSARTDKSDQLVKPGQVLKIVPDR